MNFLAFTCEAQIKTWQMKETMNGIAKKVKKFDRQTGIVPNLKK